MIHDKQKELKLFFYTGFYETGLRISKELQLYGISIDHNLISYEQIEQAHSNNIRIVLWNIKTQQENFDVLKKNPDIVQTDKIHHLLKIMGKYKR